jgi:hypothetical protein
VGGLIDAVKPVLAPAALLAEHLAAVPGVRTVDDPEYRAGDLTFRANAFFTVVADTGLSRSAEKALVDAISVRLMAAEGDTRFMVELDLGVAQIGVSPRAELNDTRLETARSLADIDGVTRATVLWHTSDDDLIFDEENVGLAVFVQATDGRPLDLLDQALPHTSALDQPTVTATVVGSHPSEGHLYDLGRSGVELGHREIEVRESAGSTSDMREVADNLAASDEVLGYRVTDTAATIAFTPATDVAQALSSLRVPEAWEVRISAPAGTVRWIAKPATGDPQQETIWRQWTSAD